MYSSARKCVRLDYGKKEARVVEEPLEGRTAEEWEQCKLEM